MNEQIKKKKRKGEREQRKKEERKKKTIYQFLKVVLPSDGTNYFLVPSLCP